MPPGGVTTAWRRTWRLLVAAFVAALSLRPGRGPAAAPASLWQGPSSGSAALPAVAAAPSLPPFFQHLGPNRFARPASERASTLTSWMHGRWGLGALELGAPLADLVIDKIGQRQVSTPVVDDELRTPAFLPALLPTGELTRRQCLDRAVTVIRYGAEADRFSLLDCAGAVADGALDRLSVLARPPEIARPDLPLPDEPTGSRGEWVDGVKMVPPRVLWLVSELARAFPHRALYLYSGYRPGGGRGHRGLHGDARALDVAVHGIDSRRLYEACRNLPDTGCGYYPHHPFVHVDVRRPGLVRAAWIDASAPGEPSVYVRSWPGVSDADPDTVSAP